MIIHWNLTICTLDLVLKLLQVCCFFGNKMKINSSFYTIFQYLFLNKHFLPNEEFKSLRCMINVTIHFIVYFSSTHSVQYIFLLFFCHYCNHTFYKARFWKYRNLRKPHKGIENLTSTVHDKKASNFATNDTGMLQINYVSSKEHTEFSSLLASIILFVSLHNEASKFAKKKHA
jgi:hypothetical protein